MRRAVSTYKPLLIITLVACLIALALYVASSQYFSQDFMGAFLILIAIQKLFDVRGFAANFIKYDLLAKRFPLYAKLYPLIELCLGLLYLSQYLPVFTNIVLIVLLLITTLGVIGTMRRGEALVCGCAGAAFTLPVGKVTVFENAVMTVMAFYHLAWHIF